MTIILAFLNRVLRKRRVSAILRFIVKIKLVRFAIDTVISK